MTQLHFFTRFIVLFTLFYGHGELAVTRSQFLRRLLRDHAQTAAVWKAIHTSLEKSVKRFERSNGLNTALYKNYLISGTVLVLKSVS